MRGDHAATGIAGLDDILNGTELAQFEGVLTGVPRFVGNAGTEHFEDLERGTC